MLHLRGSRHVLVGMDFGCRQPAAKVHVLQESAVSDVRDCATYCLHGEAFGVEAEVCRRGSKEMRG